MQRSERHGFCCMIPENQPLYRSKEEEVGALPLSNFGLPSPLIHYFCTQIQVFQASSKAKNLDPANACQTPG